MSTGALFGVNLAGGHSPSALSAMDAVWQASEAILVHSTAGEPVKFGESARCQWPTVAAITTSLTFQNPNLSSKRFHTTATIAPSPIQQQVAKAARRELQFSLRDGDGCGLLDAGGKNAEGNHCKARLTAKCINCADISCPSACAPVRILWHWTSWWRSNVCEFLKVSLVSFDVINAIRCSAETSSDPHASHSLVDRYLGGYSSVADAVRRELHHSHANRTRSTASDQGHAHAIVRVPRLDLSTSRSASPEWKPKHIAISAGTASTAAFAHSGLSFLHSTNTSSFEETLRLAP